MQQAEFDQKVAELISAANAYYHTEQSSPLSDDEYDLKLQYLEEVTQTQPELITEQFRQLVTDVAGGTIATGADVILETPMLSLQKATAEGDLRSFLDKTLEFGAGENGWVLQAKLDGIAISLRYLKGKLTQIVTRSSGEIGTDISHQLQEINRGILQIDGLALNLGNDLSEADIEIRGEIFMTREQFDFTNRQRQKSSQTKDVAYSNPRNAVAGILNRIENNNKEEEFLKRMTFLAYSVILDQKTQSHLSSDKLIDNSNQFGFWNALSITRAILDCNKPYLSQEPLLRDVRKYGELILRDNQLGKFINSPIGEILTDGIVVKCTDDQEISRVMGNTQHHPSSQIAYKYMSEEDRAETIVQNIEVSVGRTGRLALRAKVSPVLLYGSRIEYATLHNFEWLKERDVRIGSKVALIKANDVIPYVAAVLENSDQTKMFEAPNSCPLCGSALDRRTLLWRCPNDLCSSRLIPALQVAVSRNLFDIDSLSIKTLEALVEAGLVEDLADIFALNVAQLSTLDSYEQYSDTAENRKKERVGKRVPLGEKTAQKIYDSIQKAKTAPLAKVLASLNIPMLGLKIAKNLANSFATVDDLLNAPVSEFEEVDLIANLKAVFLYEGLKSRTKLIRKMQSYGVLMNNPHYQNVAQESSSEQRSAPLSGQQIVISGSVEGYNRQEANELVEQHGGVSSSSVSAKTTLVVADPSSQSSKVKKALSLGIEIITAEQFLERIGK